MTVRLYTTDTLTKGAQLAVPLDAAHYLQHVMRMKVGQGVRVFNEGDGEWEASLSHISKKGVTLDVGDQVRAPEKRPFLGLVFTPLKPAPLSFLLEKATELGVSDLYPVLTRYTSVRHFNDPRACATVRDAAQQCERLDVPRLHPLQDLGAFMAGLERESVVYACLERSREARLSQALDTLKTPPLVLVGPEGGFEAAEVTFLKNHPQVRPVSLGPSVLRAETAALAALALFHAKA